MTHVISDVPQRPELRCTGKLSHSGANLAVVNRRDQDGVPERLAVTLVVEDFDEHRAMFADPDEIFP